MLRLGFFWSSLFQLMCYLHKVDVIFILRYSWDFQCVFMHIQARKTFGCFASFQAFACSSASWQSWVQQLAKCVETQGFCRFFQFWQELTCTCCLWLLGWSGIFLFPTCSCILNRLNLLCWCRKRRNTFQKWWCQRHWLPRSIDQQEWCVFSANRTAMMFSIPGLWT